MSKGQLERIAHATASAGLSEVESIRKVLDIQQKDNYRFRDHVKMLDGEIDMLKIVCEKKQVEINKRDEVVRRRDETIVELKKFIEINRADQDAIKKYSDQNELLIEKLKEENRTIENGAREITLLKDQLRSLTETSAIKSETSISLEARFTAVMSKVREELINEKNAKKEMESKFGGMQSHINELVMTNLTHFA